MNTEIRNGARKDTARPVVVYRPNVTPSLPSVDMRSIRVRADDCVGPTNRQSSSPQTQKPSGPDSDQRTIEIAIIDAREPRMTVLDPSRSSTRPPTNAPSAAMTLALTPNSSTLALDIP